MKRVWIAAGLGIMLSLPLIAEDRSAAPPTSGTFPADGAFSAGSDELSSSVPSFAPTNSTVRRVVHEMEPRSVTDAAQGKTVTEYVVVSRVVDVPVPTDTKEIEELRKKVRALQERRIDGLGPADLLKEYHAQQDQEKQRQSWKKIQEVRDLLKSISTEFPGTDGEKIASDLQKRIPDSDKPVAPHPTPSVPASLNPLPTY